ncbi:arylsulfatase [soil metagenome]
MADDAGYGDFGCYGSASIRTPHTDQLAQNGIRFTDVYAGSTVCAPSRSVLMTGQHTGHTTVRGNFGKGGVRGLGGGAGRVPLREDDVTVAEILKGAGYATGGFGKWGLGEPETSGHPNDQGFDEWFGYLNQRRAHHYYPTFLWHNRARVELPGNHENGSQTYSHYEIERRALQFIDEHRDGRFFLYLAYTLPHGDYVIPHDDPAYQPYKEKPWPQNVRNYAAMVTRFDAALGKVVARLDELGLREDTLILVTSDNGPPQEFTGPLDSNGPLRGAKRDMSEGGIRVPMVCAWPGHLPAGETSDLPWYFADVMPTLAEVAGASDLVPPDTDGVSVLPALRGNPQPELEDRPIYWEFHERGFDQAARRGRWKAVRDEPHGPVELYDLAADIGEKTDVAGDHPQLVAEFEQFFREAHEPSASWPTALDGE